MMMSGEELCAKLFEEHYAELVRYAARLVGDPHLAEDIVVEAILVALKRSEELLTYDSPKHWLMRVVKNKSKNEMRRKYHQVEVDITEAEPPSSPAPTKRRCLRCCPGSCPRPTRRS